MMNSFFTKLAMLVMFILAVTCGWAAVTMVFPASLFNIILGILAAFFLLRAFELADRVNKLGPYAEDKEVKNTSPQQSGPKNYGEGKPDETPDEE